MFILILIAIIIGICAGIVTGLIPGVHINLVSALLVSSAAAFSNVPLLYFIIFIIAMSITHTFLDSIPSIFLGVPDPAMALAILPAHRMLLEGKGLSALKYTLYGSLAGLIISVALTPVLIFAIPLVYALLKNYIGYVILGFLLFIFLKDRKRIVKSLIVFFLAGVFGILILKMNLNNPMFHLFSGLFGISNLLLSLKTSSIPKQRVEEIIIKVRHKFSVFVATLMGVIAGFLPGMGSSQSAILGMSLMKKEDTENPSVFLTFIGGINTVNMFVSMITFYTISKARNGSIIALKEIVGSISLEILILLIVSSLLVGGLAVVIGIKISKVFSNLMQKVNYTKLIISIMTLIVAVSFIFDNFLGLLIVLIGTAIGIFTSRIGAAKSYLMGCLLLQVLVFFLG
jgi:putative membrane protein